MFFCTYAVMQQMIWGKELALAFDAASHGGNISKVLQDEQTAL
jgi:hypothetical protein